MQTYCMAKRLKGSNVSVNSSHPGVVATEISRGFNDSTFWSSVFPAIVKLTGMVPYLYIPVYTIYFLGIMILSIVHMGIFKTRMHRLLFLLDV